MWLHLAWMKMSPPEERRKEYQNADDPKNSIQNYLG
jgi:hypothetical protein